jgi:hypothetical protein
MVLDDKRMRIVRRMRVPCGERERGAPAGAISRMQCILCTYLHYMLDLKERSSCQPISGPLLMDCAMVSE